MPKFGFKISAPVLTSALLVIQADTEAEALRVARNVIMKNSDNLRRLLFDDLANRDAVDGPSATMEVVTARLSPAGYAVVSATDGVQYRTADGCRQLAARLGVFELLDKLAGERGLKPGTADLHADELYALAPALELIEARLDRERSRQ